MPEIVVVKGATTGAGKTWVTTRLAAALRGSMSVAVRKPVESFADGDERDSELLASAGGESPDIICPPHRRYELAMAPPIAASILGRPPISMADLESEMGLDALDVHLVLVEGVGGPYSPLAEDGDTATLAAAVGAALVISVVDASLGAINSAIAVAKAFPGAEVLTFLNRYDEADEVHTTNAEWLERSGHLVYRTVDELADALRSRVP